MNITYIIWGDKDDFATRKNSFHYRRSIRYWTCIGKEEIESLKSEVMTVTADVADSSAIKAAFQQFEKI